MLNGIQDFADRLLERRELIPARGFLTHIAMYIVHIYITVVPLYATSAISNAIPSCKPFVSLSHVGARVREFWVHSPTRRTTSSPRGRGSSALRKVSPFSELQV